MSRRPEAAAREALLQRRGQLLAQLYDVQRALERIELGQFGACDACGEAIELPRLEDAPWARLCGACAHSAPASHA